MLYMYNHSIVKLSYQFRQYYLFKPQMEATLGSMFITDRYLKYFSRYRMALFWNVKNREAGKSFAKTCVRLALEHYPPDLLDVKISCPK